MSQPYDIQAIDAVVNIWTPESLAIRPNRDAFFGGKMRVQQETLQGVTLEGMLKRMDAAGIERAFLIATKVGRLPHPACYHIPYKMVADAVNEYPQRFHALAGLDPTEGMAGVRAFESAVRDDGFIGAHFYPHWYELAPDHARWYPFYAKCVELDVPVQLQVGQSMVYDPTYPLRSVGRPITLDAVACDFPELKLVGIHVGIPWTDEMIAMAWKHKHVYIGRAQPEVLAGVVRALHRQLRAGQGAVRHRLSGARLRAHARRDRGARTQAGVEAEAPARQRAARLQARSSAALIPASMRAVEIAADGGPEVLRVASRDVPQPGAGEVLIRVAAAGVNRVDVFQRLGIYRPPAGTTDIPGVELAGEVVALGSATHRYRIGDRVCALVRGGGYAEYCAAPEAQVLPVPAGYDMTRAAGIMETFCTVWTALYDRARFKPGESILIHGGSSGIGTTAIMLARADGSPAIFATAGSAEKCAACERIGATRAINYRTEDFEAVVREATGGKGVDVIVDIVAGDYVPKNLALLRPDGRLVFVGRMSQKVDVAVNVLRIMYDRLVVTGVSLRGQSVEQKRAIVSALERRASGGSIGLKR